MNYTHSLNEDFFVLSLSGDLIGEENNTSILTEADHYISRGVNKAIIDISNVRYINSSGIGVLISLLTKVRNKDGDICLINPSENVQKLLIITKLNAIFRMASTVEEAKRELQKI